MDYAMEVEDQGLLGTSVGYLDTSSFAKKNSVKSLKALRLLEQLLEVMSSSNNSATAPKDKVPTLLHPSPAFFAALTVRYSDSSALYVPLENTSTEAHQPFHYPSLRTSPW